MRGYGFSRPCDYDLGITPGMCPANFAIVASSILSAAQPMPAAYASGRGTGEIFIPEACETPR